MGRGEVVSSKLALGLQTSKGRFRHRKGPARVTKTGEVVNVLIWNPGQGQSKGMSIVLPGLGPSSTVCIW